MSTLVTGAAGFLGRYVVEQLVARGERVRAMVRRPDTELSALGVELVLADLTDRDRVLAACAGCHTIHHVAGLAGVWGPWRDFYDVNVRGTAHILEGCRQHGVRKLIYTSSPSVTFDGTDQCGVDESAAYPTKWLAHYPHTKALAEQAVLSAHDERQTMTCALRPHLIWGPRDRHLIPRLIARAKAGQLRRVGDGKNVIDMVYVENAAAAHLAAADHLQPGSPLGGRPYFISQGEPVNCWDWIDQILLRAGLPKLARSISAKRAYQIGAVLETVHRLLGLRREPRMTRFVALQLSTSHYFDISAARRDFGYAPAVSMSDGLDRLAASW